MESVLSERLRELRTKKRPLRSMQVTSELMGLPRGALRKYETGEATPTVVSLAMIADYYQVSMDYLWGRESITPAIKSLSRN